MRGPPDEIEVISEAEIPNQELVRPKPIPSKDQTEKFFRKLLESYPWEMLPETSITSPTWISMSLLGLLKEDTEPFDVNVSGFFSEWVETLAIVKYEVD